MARSVDGLEGIVRCLGREESSPNSSARRDHLYEVTRLMPPGVTTAGFVKDADARSVLTVAYMAAGVLHFSMPGPFVAVTPD